MVFLTACTRGRRGHEGASPELLPPEPESDSVFLIEDD